MAAIASEVAKVARKRSCDQRPKDARPVRCWTLEHLPKVDERNGRSYTLSGD